MTNRRGVTLGAEEPGGDGSRIVFTNWRQPHVRTPALPQIAVLLSIPQVGPVSPQRSVRPVPLLEPLRDGGFLFLIVEGLQPYAPSHTDEV
ncbi:hypothetical protein SKAU_G00009980 [Synaphobranchus kaupii]|uniref:Uncharacterized protein n=1 Tax=Synaphobranchus kaupii TaxID=118154 RepID=A0A9Q1JCV0_SYNKA|nr:hypothetical protein SKAU_G00009980 [Synaphobranchus kaupii]